MSLDSVKILVVIKFGDVNKLTDSDTLGMNCAKVGVLKEGDEVGLDGFLESTDGRRLEAEIGLEVLSNFTDQALERQLADQKLGGLLITTDLTEGDGTYYASLV